MFKDDRPAGGPQRKDWERTREAMKEKGLFPTGAPHVWTKCVAPENAKSTHPNDWWTLSPEELALNPMYAEKKADIRYVSGSSKMVGRVAAVPGSWETFNITRCTARRSQSRLVAKEGPT